MMPRSATVHQPPRVKEALLRPEGHQPTSLAASLTPLSCYMDPSTSSSFSSDTLMLDVPGPTALETCRSPDSRSRQLQATVTSK